MATICILATSENVAAVREKAKEIFPELGQVILPYPLSATGEEPATHWFCESKISDELAEKILSNKVLSEMEVSTAKNFLREKGLKSIRRK